MSVTPLRMNSTVWQNFRQKILSLEFTKKSENSILKSVLEKFQPQRLQFFFSKAITVDKTYKNENGKKFRVYRGVHI